MTTYIAVCDDDKTTADIVAGAAEKIFAAHKADASVCVFHSAKELMKGMRERAFDLLLLDIEMPGADGVELGKLLRKNDDPVDIVFVSAREDRVFETFEVHPFGFVRKSTFVKDISLVIDAFISKRIAMASSAAGALVVNTREGMSSIPVDKIIYIEGCRKDQLAHVTTLVKPVTLCSSMEKLEEKLTDAGFIRAHKGFLINYAYISVIGTDDIRLTTGETLPLSRRKKQEVKERYMTLVQEKGNIVI